LAEDAEEEIGVGRGEMETANEAADFFVGWSGGTVLLGAGGWRFEIAAGEQRIKES
jgi:hypothetical protein